MIRHTFHSIFIAAVVLIVSNLSFAFIGGDGTAEDPYQIATADQLVSIGSDAGLLDKHYILTSDIDLAGYEFTTAVIAPDVDDASDGFQGTAFTGTFNGNGHIVSNLKIDTLSDSDQINDNNDQLGLFGVIAETVNIFDLGIEDAYIHGGEDSDKIGCLAGWNLRGSISCCYSDGSAVGGIYIGGLIGFNREGDITNCYSNCNVEGAEYLAGLVGLNGYGEDQGGYLTNCYSTGKVTGNKYKSNVNISGLQFSMIGSGGWSKAENCFFDTETSKFFWYSDSGEYESWEQFRTTAEMRDSSMFIDAGWDYSEDDGDPAVWCAVEGYYPALKWQVKSLGQVPDVAGVDQGQADSLLVGSGFRAGHITENYSDTLPVGHVISQQLQAGMSFPEGLRIALVVSLGKAYSGGAGTAADPCRISKPEDIIALSQRPEDYYRRFVMTNDIDMGGYTFTEAVIGSDTDNSGEYYYGDSFKGTFDGNGYKIIKLTIDTGGEDNHYIALFGILSNINRACIKNLTLENATVTGGEDSRYVGALVANNYGTITNCHASGFVKGYRYVGGLVGFHSRGRLEDCHSKVTVEGHTEVGGLIGTGGVYYDPSAIVTHCSSSGDVTAGYWVGGLIGAFSRGGEVRNSYSTSEVTATREGGGSIGGLIGSLSEGTIANCYSMGIVNFRGSTNTAGLIGSCSNSKISVTNCYSACILKGDWPGKGLIGYNNIESSINSFWEIESSRTSSSASGTGKTTVEMMTLSTFTDAGWDFSEDGGNEADWKYTGWYPVFPWQELVEIPDVTGMGHFQATNTLSNAGLKAGNITYIIHCCVPAGQIISQLPVGGGSMLEGFGVSLEISLGDGSYSGGDGTEEEPWQINKPEDLVILNRTVEDYDNHFIMTADIDMKLCSFTSAVIAPNKPSTSSSKFYGTPFSGVFNGNGFKICNLIIDPSLDFESNDTSFQGLFGQINEEGKVINLGMDNLVVHGNEYIGAITGQNFGTISNCYSNGSIYGYLHVGGLVGCNGGFFDEGGIIAGSYSTGSVEGYLFISGLASFNNGTITNCYSNSTVTGNNIGGLCRSNSGTITNCYSSGKVIGIGDGYHSGLCGLNRGTITNSFWDVEASGQATSSGGIGKTTVEMQSLLTFVDAGWDFEGDWWINDGRDYPRFSWQPFGDVNNDCRVDAVDLGLMGASWMATDSDPDFNSVCELSGDDSVGIDDLSVIVDMWLSGPQYDE